MSAEEKNCYFCAYKQETSNGIWCPYHDAAVTRRNVCDDFLHHMETPQWKSLIEDINETPKSPVRQILIWDVLAYFVMGFCLILTLFYPVSYLLWY